MHYKDAKRDFERKLWKLLKKPADHTGVIVLKLSVREGSITSGLVAKDEEPIDWQRLGDMK